MIKSQEEKKLHIELWEEGEAFYNESYSGTQISEFLKPYIINSYTAGKRSAMHESVEEFKRKLKEELAGSLLVDPVIIKALIIVIDSI